MQVRCKANQAFVPQELGKSTTVSSALQLLGAFVLILASAGLAQSKSVPTASTKRAAAENLTLQLLSLHGQYKTAAPAERLLLLRRLQSVAAMRQKLLSSLMETDPGAVLRVAAPAGLAASLPAAVQSSLEQRVQLQGKLEVIYEDSKSQARLRHFLLAGGQRLELRFAQNQPTHLLTGAVVRVKGVRVEDKVAVASGTSTTSLQTVSNAPLPNTFGAQNTLVVLVNFQNNTSQPYTSAYAYNETFVNNSNFYLENSYGQTWFTGNVVGWYTLPIASTCDYNSITTYANQAATAAGVNLSSYQRFVYAFPSTSCGWWGTGQVGGSQAWIDGSYLLAVLSHELGHELGLYHSHSLSCAPNVDTGTCSTSEYGDTLDMMGNPYNFEGAHFNAFQKQRLGWLNYGSSPPIMTVQSNGTFTITPYEQQDGTTKALKIFQSKNSTTGQTTWYYVEFRQAMGFDSFLSNYSNITHGVVLHLGTDGNSNSSDLLDMTPLTSSWLDVALDTGLSFTDPTTGTSINTVSASSSGASISVNLGGGASCTHSNPVVSMSPTQSAYVAAGTTVSFTVSVSNTDNSACSSSTFNLSASAPSGWSAALSSSSLTLAPGVSASTTLKVTSPAGTANGFYTVGATATNSSAPSYTASASATYALSAPVCTPANPTVTLSPGQSAMVSPGTMVSYTVAVKNNDSTACSASTFNLNGSGPSGWSAALGSATLSLAPGASASTSLQVTSPTSAANGSYPVGATASNALTSTYSASGSAAYVIGSSSLAITVVANQSTYSAGQTVVLTVSVSSGGAAAAGVGVTVNIGKPNGATVTQTATTGSNGTATVSYRLKKRDPVGLYAVAATVNSSGAASVAATTTFTVQ